MSFSPLTPVTDYQSMLNRIFWFTSAVALVAVWILRIHLPWLDGRLHAVDFTVEFGGNKVLPMPGGFLLPAIAVGLLARIYRLHGRISNWLGIRESFDIDVIIRELARQLRIDSSSFSREQLIADRHGMMRKAFYPFVSGNQPNIDVQLIHQALDAWSWFWIGVEASFVFIVTGVGLMAGGAYDVGALTISGTIVAMALALPPLRNQCRRYAVAQVRAILADPRRAAAVREALSEFTAIRFLERRAA